MTAPGHERGPRRVFVSIAYAPAVAEPRVRRQCESLARAGWRVIQVGLAQRDEARTGRRNGVVYLRMPQRRYRGSAVWRYAWEYLAFSWRATRVLRRILRRGPVDVVQVTNVPDALIFAARSARRRGAGLILDIRDPLPEFFLSKFGHRWFGLAGYRAAVFEERWASGTADLVFTANEIHRRRTEAHGVAHHKVHVVPNYADATVCPMQAPRCSNRVIAYHGTVAPRMGLDLVMRAVARLGQAGVPLRFLIFGDGDGVAPLQALRDRLALGDQVSVSGDRFQIEEVAGRLQPVGLGIVSLQRDALTDLFLSMKLLEYVRLGIPAVVTWTPTLGHYFPDDSVFFVRESSVDAWADAIRTAVGDPLGAQARARRAQALPVARPWQDAEADYLAMVERAAGLHRDFHRSGTRH
ncbi:MAG TPA: glycosyltransferase [Gemmatimonadales bacterium]|jgi:glycosyltransferase involved in cell wall biosynthesis|nr:glycosyltransferase [Gemmatimonadales bacterium]